MDVKFRSSYLHPSVLELESFLNLVQHYLSGNGYLYQGKANKPQGRITDFLPQYYSRTSIIV